jgi:hypothetical protein
MKKRDLIISLTGTERLLIKPRGPYTIAELNCCDPAHIFLLKDEDKYPLYDHDMPLYHAVLEDFCEILVKALAGELKLNPIVQEDVGLAYNKYKKADRYGVPGVNRPENTDYLLYDHHRIWCSNSSSTWLYNDAAGSIIIEVAPNYRWDLYEKRKQIIPYKRFIKNYKPIWKEVLSYDIALMWLKHTIDLMEAMKHTFTADSKKRDPEYTSSDAKESVLGSIYGFEKIKTGFSEKHKKIFEEAGLASYIVWLEKDRNRLL